MRFMLGDRPTIVDFSLVGYLYYPCEETGFDLAAAFPAIDAWRGRCRTAQLEAALRDDARWKLAAPAAMRSLRGLKRNKNPAQDVRR